MSTWYVKDAPENLVIGPGDQKDGRCVTFVKGFAVVDDTAPDYAERVKWSMSFGAPPVKRDVTADERAVIEAVDAELKKRARDAQMGY
jgi:hypothetical protein